VDTWAALFLRSASPGAVFRFFERRRRAGEAAPGPLLLSDAAPANGWRALIGPPDWLAAQAEALSRAFAPRVTLLRQSAMPTPEWGFTVYEAGAVAEEGGESLSAKQRPLLHRLAGVKPALSPPVLWARERGLPVERVPGAVSHKGTVPVIEYRTVAGLDQRSLLIEDGPRLYRFDSTGIEAEPRGV
jgi:hypothetical protein